jgi:hypothetical protein
MKLTAQRKAAVLVLAVACCALLADRLFLGGGALGPQSARATQGLDPAPLTSEAPAQPAPAPTAPVRTLAARLGALAGDAGEPPSLFTTGAEWIKPPEAPAQESSIDEPAAPTLAQLLAGRRITGVIFDKGNNGKGSLVFIDGSPRPVGYTFSGVRVAAIDRDGNVTFEYGDQTETRNFTTPRSSSTPEKPKNPGA